MIELSLIMLISILEYPISTKNIKHLLISDIKCYSLIESTLFKFFIKIPLNILYISFIKPIFLQIIVYSI
jgi:hypothetical protein